VVHGVVHCLAPPRRRHAHRALARLQLEQASLSSFFMPSFLQSLQGTRIVRSGQDIVARVFAARPYIWARPILVEARAEVLARGHTFAIDWRSRCVSFLFILVLLMFSSVYARLGQISDEIWLSLNDGDFARLKDLAGHFVLLAGEATLLYFVVHFLEQAVSHFILFA